MTTHLRLATTSLYTLPVSTRSSLLSTTNRPPVDAWTLSSSHSTMTSTHNQDELKNQGQKPMLARQRAKEETVSNSQQSKGSPFFPLAYRDAFSQWWASWTPAITEQRVLSFVPYLQQAPMQTQTGTQPALDTDQDPMPIDTHGAQSQSTRTERASDPYGPRQYNSNLVVLSGKNRAMNEFSISRPGEEVQNNICLIHGYGAGLGFFYKNFEVLSRLAGWKLFALDLLGMGRSSRPPFRIHAKNKEGKVREAENWFIDALEEWRVKRGIESMTLVGHSLGGYLAVCYALKYPGHLNKLILASPVGIPEDPYAVNDDIPEPRDSTMENEFTQSQEDVTTAKTNSEKEVPRRRRSKWLAAAWDANISPFSLVRLSGPLGPRFVSGWTSRRFSHLPLQESQALHDYSYSLFRQRGSGEYALAYILAPGAYARSPLIRRIQDVGRQLYTPSGLQSGSKDEQSHLVNKVRETGVPVCLLYGDSDWMDVNGGYAARDKLNEQRRKALSAIGDGEEGRKERLKENGEAKVFVIKNSGHHVYLDGCDQFNDIVLKELKDVEETQKRLKMLDR